MAVALQIVLLFATVALIYVNSVEMAVFSENITNSELESYKDFLAAISVEENIENCLFYGEPRKNEVLNLFLLAITEHFRKPVILQNLNGTKQEIANRFGSEMIIIAQIEYFEMELSTLATTLERMRQRRIILISAERLTQRTTELYLMHVFRHCEMEKLLNVVVIFSDFPKTKLFHSYSIFPNFALEAKIFSAKGEAVFPQRMRDLQGFGIRTVPDQIFPWSFTYELDGQVKISGYVQKLMEAYASYKNATLSYPIPVLLDDATIASKISELMSSNKIDIPTGRKYLEMPTNFDEASIPFDVSGLFIMAPIVLQHSFWKFLCIYSDWRHLTFSMLSCWSTITLFYFCRRLQYTRERRRYYKNFFAALLEPNYWSSNFGAEHTLRLRNLVTLRLIICVSAIYTLFLSTHFTANLNTFITKPAMLPNPQSWNDLNEVGLKVLFSKLFYVYVRSWCDEACANIEPSLDIIDSPELARTLPLGYNISYAYPTYTFSFNFIQLQMRQLKQPIFRLTDICLKQQMLHCIFLQRNSIFKESLDLFLMRVLDHGLQEYWIGVTYMEAMRYGTMTNIKNMDRMPEKPLDMEYISFMWPLLGFAWSLASCIFAVELVSARWRTWI